MNYWEDYYIETFDLYAKNGKGYNVDKGGSGGNTFAGKTEEEIKEIFNEETRRKMSEAKKGKNGVHKGIHRYGKDAPNYGKYHSKEYKQKMSEAHKGKNNPRAKRVAQYDKQGNLIKIWDYAKQASKELRIAQGSICQCCKGKIKTAGGYIWRYAEETE